MAETIEPLVRDLVEWVGNGRSYADVMDAWKTSCPRLPVWEEANARGLLERRRDGDGTEWVRATSAGRQLLCPAALAAIAPRQIAGNQPRRNASFGRK